MAAPKGNRFWEVRSTHGRKPQFETPEILEEACMEYLQWVEDNPLEEERVFHHQGAITRTKVSKMRAMTIEGLCLFLDINDQTWRNYKARKEYLGVVSRVERAMRTQKFTGAAADLLNPNIIARDLGLADKSELSGPGGAPIEVDDKSERDPMELARIVAFAMAKAAHDKSNDEDKSGG